MKKQLVIESNSDVYIELNNTDTPIQLLSDFFIKKENKKSIFVDTCFEHCKIKISTKYFDSIKITDFSTAIISSNDNLISEKLKFIVEDNASLSLTKSIFNTVSVYSSDSSLLNFEKTLINFLSIVSEDYADVKFVDSFFYDATVSSSDNAVSYFKNTFVKSIDVKAEDLSTVNNIVLLSRIKLYIDDFSECSYSYININREETDIVLINEKKSLHLGVIDELIIPVFENTSLYNILKIIKNKDVPNDINYMIKSILEKKFPTDHINPENRNFICEYIEKNYSFLNEKLEQKEIENMNKLIRLFNINTGLNSNIDF